jgi:ParB-like chromosome segregation protein Spo0J
MSSAERLIRREVARREYPAHPLAERLPLMRGEEFDALVDDIKRNGLLEPITLLDGKILDGRNRFRACIMADVPPTMVEWDGECESPAAYVYAKNIPRRHLTSSQRAAMGADLLDELEIEARERQRATLKRGSERPVVEEIPEREQGRARDKAAEIVGTNPRYVSDAKKVRDRDVMLFEQVKDGTISLPEAARRSALAEKIDRFPEDERDDAKTFLHSVIDDGNHTRIAMGLADNLLEMPAEDRLRLFVMSQSENPRERSLARTEAANLPPEPHPSLPPARDALRELAKAARHLNGDSNLSAQYRSARGEIETFVTMLKEAS